VAFCGFQLKYLLSAGRDGLHKASERRISPPFLIDISNSLIARAARGWITVFCVLREVKDAREEYLYSYLGAGAMPFSSFHPFLVLPAFLIGTV